MTYLNSLGDVFLGVFRILKLIVSSLKIFIYSRQIERYFFYLEKIQDEKNRLGFRLNSRQKHSFSFSKPYLYSKNPPLYEQPNHNFEHVIKLLFIFLNKSRQKKYKHTKIEVSFFWGGGWGGNPKNNCFWEDRQRIVCDNEKKR